MSNSKREAFLAGKATHTGRTLITNTFGLAHKDPDRPYFEIQEDLYAAAVNEMVGNTDGQDYISWYNTATVFDHIAPGWWYTIDNLFFGDPVRLPGFKPKRGQEKPPRDAYYVRAIVTIHIPTSNGVVSRPGYAEEEYLPYGADPMSKVLSRAFRKAAAFHGFARSLWYKDDEQSFEGFDEPQQAEEPTTEAFPKVLQDLDARVQNWLVSNEYAGIDQFLKQCDSWIDSWKTTTKKDKAKAALGPLREHLQELAKGQF